jgi:DNA polymerase elongation subunit (family B)
MAIKYQYLKRRLWLFGVDANGLSVSVGVTNFKPSVLVKASDIGEDVEAWRLLVNLDLLQAHPPASNKYKKSKDDEDAEIPEYICEIRAEQRTPLIGFTNGRKDQMLRLICNDIDSHALVLNHLQTRNTKLYHEDWALLNQFLHITQFQYQDWLEFDVQGVTHFGSTFCNVEATVAVETPRKTEKVSAVAQVLKCFIRIVAVSQTALAERRFQMRPNSSKPFDRVVAAMLAYYWTNSETLVHQQIISMVPAGDQTNADYNFRLCATESQLLHAIKQSIVEWDPDVIMHFGDTLDTFAYLAKRAEVNRVPDALAFERFRGQKCQFFGKAPFPPKFRCDTRSIIDLVAFLKKKVFVSVESLDLPTVSCHPDFRKDPCQPSDFDYGPNDTAKFLLAGTPGRRRVLTILVNELRFVVALERDCGVWLEQTNISLVGDTPLTNTVEGEQKRVYNKITHYCHDKMFYINRDALARKPLRFAWADRPPTFPDPVEHQITNELRATSIRALASRLALQENNGNAPKRGRDKRLVNCFGDQASSDGEKEVDEAEGGNVMHPSPGFWSNENPVAILDFASLYPSVMMAFNVSYDTLVLEEQYLDIPGVPYIVVPINSYETVVLADVFGLLPQILRCLVDSRTAIKKLMKLEKDPFKQSILDKGQNSMKTYCNATYGFCGADSRSGALLAYKTIMFVVTAIGRYLQKTTAFFLADVYRCPTIYGDTDSLFAVMKHDRSSTIEHMTEDAAIRYKMDGFIPEKPFTWPNVCVFYEKLIDVRQLRFEFQIHAVLYLVYRKLAAEASARLRKGIVLDFENMADNVWMGWVKKHYCYRLWDPVIPGKMKKIKVTGMASKKREYTPWTRMVLETVTDLLLNNRVHEVHGFLAAQMERLVSGTVSIDSLKVSRSYHGELEYKNFNHPHLQVVLKREQREGCKVPANSRVYFVITCGAAKLFMRSETPEYVQEHGLKLDLMYYMQKQLYKPVVRLLTFHSEIVQFDSLFAVFVKRLTLSDKGLSEIGAQQAETRKKWTLQDFVNAKRKKSAGIA